MTPTRYIAQLCALGYVALGLAACAKDTPVPPQKLTPPAPTLMLAPEILEPIPKCEAQTACRVKHYANVRAQYGRLADRTRGLQSYVRELKL